MIPLASTTLTVYRLPEDSTRDGYDPQPARVQVGTGLRAHIGSPSGRATISDGDRVIVGYTLHTDGFDFQQDDQIVDDTTGITYLLLWAKRTTVFGMDFCQGAVRVVEGAG
jgi:hypothetical protein